MTNDDQAPTQPGVPLETIKAICRVTADYFRKQGSDPKLISPIDAWTWYVSTTIESLRIIGAWNDTPAEYKAFLQLDGPGGQTFCTQWVLMTREAMLEAADIWTPLKGNPLNN